MRTDLALVSAGLICKAMTADIQPAAAQSESTTRVSSVAMTVWLSDGNKAVWTGSVAWPGTARWTIAPIQRGTVFLSLG